MNTRILTHWVGVARALAYAECALANSPPFEHIRRVPGRGMCVATFALPLQLCLTSNVRMQAGKASAGWRLGKLKKDAFLFMLSQHGRIERKPLTGRPLVRAIRFSSSEPDRCSDWAKNPIDRLRVGQSGLGIILDDAPRFVQVETWWEPAAQNRGFVFLDVWTGEEDHGGQRQHNAA